MVRILAFVGAAFTLFALWRLMSAVRQGQQRELVIGWFALMLIGAIVVFAVARVA